jgi:uncharacterized protein YbbC (DUF1343 family)
MKLRNIITVLGIAVGFSLSGTSCIAHSSTHTIEEHVATSVDENQVLPGITYLDDYLGALQGKKVAIVGNQTSIFPNKTHLVDSLLSLGVNIAKILTPEHGFRGSADAGATVKDGKDSKTGLPIISLYGKNKKPTAAQLKDVDIVIYDLQDVGVRFYTYISTLEYVIEACAENNKTLIILDRPNPMGGRVDGPVLDKQYKSFIGMQSIPVLYGLTPGEYANMIIGEKWVKAPQLKFKVVANRNYTHDTYYELPVAPSPNLKNMSAILLYPSICFFEGTQVSLGRGTDKPFQMYGHPELKSVYNYTFTPKAVVGALNPPLKDKMCFGEFITDNPKEAATLIGDGINLKWLLKAYQVFPHKADFFLFNNFINLLAGNATLKQQIIDGKTEDEIKASWKADIEKYKEIRQKYLIYK